MPPSTFCSIDQTPVGDSVASDRMHENGREVCAPSDNDSIFNEGFSKAVWNSWTQTPLKIPPKLERHRKGYKRFTTSGVFASKFAKRGIALILGGNFEPAVQEILLRTFFSRPTREKYLEATLRPVKLVRGDWSSWIKNRNVKYSDSMFKDTGFTEQDWDKLVRGCGDRDAKTRRAQFKNVFRSDGQIRDHFTKEAIPLCTRSIETQKLSQSQVIALRKFLGPKYRPKLQIPRLKMKPTKSYSDSSSPKTKTNDTSNHSPTPAPQIEVAMPLRQLSKSSSPSYSHKVNINMPTLQTLPTTSSNNGYRRTSYGDQKALIQLTEEQNLAERQVNHNNFRQSSEESCLSEISNSTISNNWEDTGRSNSPISCTDSPSELRKSTNPFHHHDHANESNSIWSSANPASLLTTRSTPAPLSAMPSTVENIPSCDPELGDIDITQSWFHVINTYIVENFVFKGTTASICGPSALKLALKHLIPQSYSYHVEKRLLLKLLNLDQNVRELPVSTSLDRLPSFFSLSSLIHSVLGYFIFEKLRACRIRQSREFSNFFRFASKKMPNSRLIEIRKEHFRKQFSDSIWTDYLLNEVSRFTEEADRIIFNMTKNIEHIESQSESLKVLFARVLNLHTRYVIQLGDFEYFWPNYGEKNVGQYLQKPGESEVALTKLFGVRMPLENGIDLVVNKAEVWAQRYC